MKIFLCNMGFSHWFTARLPGQIIIGLWHYRLNVLWNQEAS